MTFFYLIQLIFKQTLECEMPFRVAPSVWWARLLLPLALYR